MEVQREKLQWEKKTGKERAGERQGLGRGIREGVGWKYRDM